MKLRILSSFPKTKKDAAHSSNKNATMEPFTVPRITRFAVNSRACLFQCMDVVDAALIGFSSPQRRTTEPQDAVLLGFSERENESVQTLETRSEAPSVPRRLLSWSIELLNIAMLQASQ